jgi:hypothetical protein
MWYFGFLHILWWYLCLQRSAHKLLSQYHCPAVVLQTLGRFGKKLPVWDLLLIMIEQYCKYWLFQQNKYSSESDKECQSLAWKSSNIIRMTNPFAKPPCRIITKPSHS